MGTHGIAFSGVKGFFRLFGVGSLLFLLSSLGIGIQKIRVAQNLERQSIRAGTNRTAAGVFSLFFLSSLSRFRQRISITCLYELFVILICFCIVYGVQTGSRYGIPLAVNKNRVSLALAHASLWPRVNPYATAPTKVDKFSSDEMPWSIENCLLSASISCECGGASYDFLPSFFSTSNRQPLPSHHPINPGTHPAPSSHP